MLTWSHKNKRAKGERNRTGIKLDASTNIDRCSPSLGDSLAQIGLWGDKRVDSEIDPSKELHFGG